MEFIDVLTGLAVLLAVLCSFVISASVGLGGSLLMVPTIALVVGPKEGVALAALLLGMNNVFKVGAYRATIPWRRSVVVVVLTAVGAAIGATALTRVPNRVVAVVVVASFALTLVFERRQFRGPSSASLSPVLAFGAGATSGFSGTSGPLKGVAIRNLGLDRHHFVGAASLASLAGDLTKTAVFTEASLLGTQVLVLGLCALPLMLLGTTVGRHLNCSIGEKAFSIMFWSVITGYSVRAFVALF